MEYDADKSGVLNGEFYSETSSNRLYCNYQED